MKRIYQFPESIKDNIGISKASEDPLFDWLRLFLNSTKGTHFETGRVFADGRWWVQFRLDLKHPLVWVVIQEFAYVINNKAIGSKLPLKLIPWTGSPENGSPERELTWRIECYDSTFKPDDLVAEASTQVAKKVTSWPPKAKRLEESVNCSDS